MAMVSQFDFIDVSSSDPLPFLRQEPDRHSDDRLKKMEKMINPTR
jgi:hypothetical protein